MSTKRLNLTVDAEAADLLERMAGGRNKMGDYLSTLLKSMNAGTPADEIERVDRESLKLMLQGMAGRLTALEGQYASMQATVAKLIADQAKGGR